jgi:hypothetical protein
MDMLVLIIALLVSLTTLLMLLRMLKQLNSEVDRSLEMDSDPKDSSTSIEDVEAMMDRLDEMEE